MKLQRRQKVCGGKKKYNHVALEECGFPGKGHGGHLGGEVMLSILTGVWVSRCTHLNYNMNI